MVAVLDLWLHQASPQQCRNGRLQRTGHLCRPRPPLRQIRMGTPNPQANGIRRGAFGRGFGHEGAALVNGVTELAPLSRPEGTGGVVSVQPEEGSPQKRTVLAPRSQTACLQTCEKRIVVVYKPPSLWPFVITA